MIDSHCHLSELSPDELTKQLTTARSIGVRGIVSIGSGYGLDGMRRTLEQAAASGHAVPLFPTAGIHPHEAKDFEAGAIAEFENLLQNNPPICAVGEIGLDFHYNFSAPEVQEDIFRKCLCLARQTKKPVVIHDRECQHRCIQIIQEEGASAFCGVAHCFSGDWALAKAYLDLGFYLSFSGIITFPKAKELREVLKKTPPDRILVETDSPYLAPVPHRGKTNEPAFVAAVVQALADTLSISQIKAAELSAHNACRVFCLPQNW